MQDDNQITPLQKQDENKKSNATELHETGLENVYKAILRQDASKLKKQLQQIELKKNGLRKRAKR